MLIGILNDVGSVNSNDNISPHSPFNGYLYGTDKYSPFENPKTAKKVSAGYNCGALPDINICD